MLPTHLLVTPSSKAFHVLGSNSSHLQPLSVLAGDDRNGSLNHLEDCWLGKADLKLTFSSKMSSASKPIRNREYLCKLFLTPSSDVFFVSPNKYADGELDQSDRF